MPSPQDDFNELLRRIKDGRAVAHASFEPVYYLVFDPAALLEVKRHLPAWTARLKNEGWDVHVYSIADRIADVFAHAPTRQLWLSGDRKAPLDWSRTNKALANGLTVQTPLQAGLETLLAELEGKPNAIVLVTDLEALHPYLRIGAIEAQLQGQFHSPTVFFYPGLRTGKTQLRFLGFYPEDGNYRSVHVGG